MEELIRVDVVLRRYFYGPFRGSIDALMPLEFWGYNNPNLVACYSHIGQHSCADYNIVVSKTEPVDENDDDAQVLLKELRDIGYIPVIRRRRPNWSTVLKLFKQRQQEWKNLPKGDS